eukprot:scaffold426003_cov32-Prasinocladus_malaysianus.AAC.1
MPYSGGSPTRKEFNRIGGETSELTFMLPAFKTTVMGMQAHEGNPPKDQHQMAAPHWSPDNEA